VIIFDSLETSIDFDIKQITNQDLSPSSKFHPTKLNIVNEQFQLRASSVDSADTQFIFNQQNQQDNQIKTETNNNDRI